MMRRNRGKLISHIFTHGLLICIYASLLESKSANLETNTTGARAAAAAADADLSSDTELYDTHQGTGAQNGGGITRGPPVLTQGDSQTVEVLARENVELKCPVTSEPPPIYDWFKGNDRIDSSWERFELSSSRESNTISIRSVKHEDAGEYICKAVNGFGKGSFTIHLVVTGEDPFKDNYLKSLPPSRRNGVNNNNSSSSSTTERPEILKDQLPREKTIALAKGSNSTLKCEASGNPRPNITWFKDNIQLGIAKQDVSHLKLTNIVENDAGLYRCEAINHYGKSTFEIMIEVEVGPWHQRARAEIVNLTPHNLTLFPGENGSITCLARFENELQPHIFWVKRVDSVENIGKRTIFYNGSYFDVLSRTDIKENSKHLFATDLVLTNVSRADAGSYHCVVAGRMGYTHSEAHVFIETDPVLLHKLQLSKERAVTIQWAVFSCFVFLITTVLVLACIYKMYSCQRQAKPNLIPKSQSSRVLPPVPFFRCNNSGSISSPGADRSAGDTTVSTTLSNPNPSNENIQPLVTDNPGQIHHSSSSALSASASACISPKLRHNKNRRYTNLRGLASGSHRHEQRYRQHKQLVKPPSVQPCNGGADVDLSDDARHEMHKLYNSTLNQIYSNSDDCVESDGPPEPHADFPDFDMRDSVSAYLSRRRHSSQSLFRNGPSKEGSVASMNWSYASNHQPENLNNATQNDLLGDTDMKMRPSRSERNSHRVPQGVSKYVYPDHERRVNAPVWDDYPEVFHDKNLNSCYYLNKNINDVNDFQSHFQPGERLNKRKRRVQTHQKPRYHQPPASPVSFYSNAPIIV